MIIPTVWWPTGEPGQADIKICEDTDGDGKADKFTVFADKLNLATALVFVNGGIIVSEARHMLFLKDTNGDDKADVREALLPGWGIGDTHAMQSNLARGFDNWLYGAVGYSNFRGNVGGKDLQFGQGIFRFKADGSALGIPPPVQQQHLGLWPERRWRCLRLNRQWQPVASTATCPRTS